MHLTYWKIRKKYNWFSAGKGMAKHLKSNHGMTKKPGFRAFSVVSQEVLQFFAAIGGYNKSFSVVGLVLMDTG